MRLRQSEPGEHSLEGPRRAQQREHDGRTLAAPKTGEHPQRGRTYDTLTARFMSADPVMQAPFWSQGLNRYAYTFNDPINNTDPSGFLIKDDPSTSWLYATHGGIAAGIGAGAGIAGLAGGFDLGGLVTGLFNIAIGVPSLQGLGSQGGRFSGPTGAKAATNTPATTAATQATDLNKGIKAPVQERRAAGPKASGPTEAELEDEFLREFGQDSLPATAPPTLDPDTERIIQTALRPEIQQTARDHLLQLRRWGIDVRIGSAYRSTSEQANLYANRKPGFRVARPGNSAHGAGAGYDIKIYTSQGKYIPYGSEFRYQLAGRAGQDIFGLEWGGTWTPDPDFPHFQLSGWRQLPPWP